MADTIVMNSRDNKHLYDASSGIVSFKIKYPLPIIPVITLYTRQRPLRELHKIILGNDIEVISKKGKNKQNFKLHIINFELQQQFNIYWYDGVLMIRQGNIPEPVVSEPISHRQHIGFVHFGEKSGQLAPIEWAIDVSPLHLKEPPLKLINKGKLHWIKMAVTDPLPEDAMIGGFENEPLYIIRARHNQSICPGKFQFYSKQVFVPWRRQAHRKTDFEVLCGFDAYWVSTVGNYIPENAFIAGYSELRHEPLFVGRGKHKGYALIGKVHCYYGNCFLPYKTEEIELRSYEILVEGTQTKAIPGFKNML